MSFLSPVLFIIVFSSRTCRFIERVRTSGINAGTSLSSYTSYIFRFTVVLEMFVSVVSCYFVPCFCVINWGS